MNLIKKGTTDVTRYVNLVDSAAGTPETSYTITNLDLQYTRNRTAPAAKVDATALAATDSSHSDNKAIEVDATSSPGLYRIDWPDAAFATGADKVILVVSGSGLHPAVEEIQLVNFDPEDGVRLGLTALPNAAADAAGGLPISDAGGLDLDAKIGALTFGTANRVNAQVYGMENNTMTAAAAASDLTTELQSGLATAAELAKVPKSDSNVTWNATAAAQLQSEAADALNAYDPPTNAEMEAALAAADDTVLAAIAAVQADLPQRITKNTALANFMFTMVDATDHVTGETGLTITATRSLDGAAFGPCANSASEVGNGVYKIDLAAADLNANNVTLKFTGTGADTRIIHLVTQNT